MYAVARLLQEVFAVDVKSFHELQETVGDFSSNTPSNISHIFARFYGVNGKPSTVYHMVYRYKSDSHGDCCNLISLQIISQWIGVNDTPFRKHYNINWYHYHNILNGLPFWEL